MVSTKCKVLFGLLFQFMLNFSSAMDRFIDQELLNSLCDIKDTSTNQSLADVIHADNEIFIKFSEDKDVSNEVIRSCMSTLGFLMSQEKNFTDSGELFEDDDNGIASFIDVLKVRLFKMCIAHYRSLGYKSPEEKANSLYEKLLDVIKSKVSVLLKSES